MIALKEHAKTPLDARIAQILDFTSSLPPVGHVAQQTGLRLAAETDGDQHTTQFIEAAVRQPLAEVLAEVDSDEGADLYLKVSRKVACVDV